MSVPFLNQITRALKEAPQAFKQISNPILIMTLLVKNEEDNLEENLCFHKAMGIDSFIITDNNSTDGTIEIIRKYQEKGWIKEVIIETATNYNQKTWVDRMIRLAQKKYHADWVINADADELWYSPSGDLKTELRTTKANVLKCTMKCMYPEAGKPFWEWEQAIHPIINPLKYKIYNLSRYSLYLPQRGKVLHRTTSYVQISTGNHKVLMLPYNKKKSNICIYHYSIRDKKGFLEKMINGGKQLEQNPHKHIGAHWRYFYELYKNGLLEMEYDRITGANVYDQLKKDGYIQTDSTIADFFKQKLNKQAQ